jgi:hypothetical protein
MGSLLRTYTTTPLYQAQARLMIEMEDEQTQQVLAGAINSGGSTQWQDAKIYSQTHQRILTSREVARRVVRRLDLGKMAEFGGGGPAPTELKRTLLSLADTVQPFAEALFGFAHTTGNFSAVIDGIPVDSDDAPVDLGLSSTDPAMGFGGGIVMPIGERTGIEIGYRWMRVLVEEAQNVSKLYDAFRVRF